MGRNPIGLLFIVMMVLLCACEPSSPIPRASTGDGGARLIQEVTLTPVGGAEVSVPRVLSPTPLTMAQATATAPSDESSVLQVVTLDSDIILITPTLPASKTPTPTATFTATTVPTQTPSRTPIPSVSSVLVPTTVFQPFTPIDSGIIPLPPPQYPPDQYPSSVGNQTPNTNCQTIWFFFTPYPSTCPTTPPMTSSASMQSFERGYMIWVGELGSIYVLSNVGGGQQWRSYKDEFEEWMPASDPEIEAQVPSSAWQPRRGFGLVWRNHPEVREGLGWAVQEHESPYETQIQIAQDGTIYLKAAGGGVFSLSPGGMGWQRHSP
jgi:hypothetical protein